MPIVPVAWSPAVRVIPFFPPIELLEKFDPSLQAAIIAELATVDPQIIGNVRLLPRGTVPTGPGASHIITSYTFSRPGRFNDETAGAFYGGESLSTAIAETVHHILRALRDSNAPPQTLPPRRVLHVDIDANHVVDARSAVYPQIYDPDFYGESQRFGLVVRERGHDGIVYRSVRRTGGECIAVYTVASLRECHDARELVYRYADGQVEVSEVHHVTGE